MEQQGDVLDEEGDDGYGMARRRGRGPDHERDQGKQATAKGGVGREDGRKSHGDVLAYETNEDLQSVYVHRIHKMGYIHQCTFL